MKRKITLFGSTLALVGTVVAFAASSAYPSASAGGKAARLGSASTSLGRIVVDGKARTLYLFEKDKSHRSFCYGACAAYWPPALTHGKPTVSSGLKQSLIGTTRRRNSTMQVTYAGHPLYRYAGDSGPGQTTGAGLQDFGGRLRNRSHQRGRRSSPVADAAPPTRELAQRLSGGVEVLLLWHPNTNSVEFSLHDPAAQAGCRVAVAPEHAIDAFYHPYAYADQVRHAPRRREDGQPWLGSSACRNRSVCSPRNGTP